MDSLFYFNSNFDILNIIMLGIYIGSFLSSRYFASQKSTPHGFMLLLYIVLWIIALYKILFMYNITKVVWYPSVLMLFITFIILVISLFVYLKNTFFKYTNKDIESHIIIDVKNETYNKMLLKFVLNLFYSFMHVYNVRFFNLPNKFLNEINKKIDVGVWLGFFSGLNIWMKILFLSSVFLFKYIWFLLLGIMSINIILVSRSIRGSSSQFVADFFHQFTILSEPYSSNAHYFKMSNEVNSPQVKQLLMTLIHHYGGTGLAITGVGGLLGSGIYLAIEVDKHLIDREKHKMEVEKHKWQAEARAQTEERRKNNWGFKKNVYVLKDGEYIPIEKAIEEESRGLSSELAKVRIENDRLRAETEKIHSRIIISDEKPWTRGPVDSSNGSSKGAKPIIFGDTESRKKIIVTDS